MGKSKRIGSAVMAVMLTLNIFVGLAAASADVIVEPPDVSNYKSGAYTITCPNYGISLVYQADTYPAGDADWFKCSVNSGDKIGQFIEAWAYTNYTAGYAYEAPGDPGTLVERVSYRYGNWPSQGTPAIVYNPPLYSKIVNDYSNRIYYGYQIFLARNWP